MTVALVDTNVVIDILRQKEEAIAWIGTQSQALLITPIVWMEIVTGIQAKRELRPTLDVLDMFKMVYPIQQDFDWAMHQQKRLRPNGYIIDLMDYLIASVCFRLAIPMYTHNLKHMRPLLGEDFVIKPYTIIQQSSD